ncbi:hypothetical protein F8M41_005834 [Gigaspora margarita]|uniref:Uncharacterized protein n=1 Tax=Gigaspora margarita TaxID=4874 RepID=A0A8H3X7H5_GIGMA|nr:hypothetical protein F8M41_005834 [Gigaspora margarita]
MLSTHLTITSRASNSNKCSLNVSLIGTAQGNPTIIENTDDSIIEMHITDYIIQKHEYTVYVPQVIQQDPDFYISRILHIHQNITKNLKETPIIQIPSLMTSSEIERKPSEKCKRSKEINQLIDLDFINTNFDCKSETNESYSIRTNQREPKKPVKKTSHSKILHMLQ